jgi:hypothetical protein
VSAGPGAIDEPLARATLSDARPTILTTARPATRPQTGRLDATGHWSNPITGTSERTRDMTAGFSAAFPTARWGADRAYGSPRAHLIRCVVSRSATSGG